MFDYIFHEDKEIWKQKKKILIWKVMTSEYSL